MGPGARWLVADLGHVLSRIAAGCCRGGGTVLGGKGAWAPPASQGLRTFVTAKAGYQLATLFHSKQSPGLKFFLSKFHPFYTPDMIQHETIVFDTDIYVLMMVKSFSS